MSDQGGWQAVQVDWNAVKAENQTVLESFAFSKDESRNLPYWVTMPEGEEAKLVIGDKHDPTVYQAMQQAPIVSGWFQCFDGYLYAPDADYTARELIEAFVEEALPYERIEFSTPKAYEVDWAQVDAVNQRNIKATADGDGVQFVVADSRGVQVVLVGDGHEAGLMGLWNGGPGTIYVKKGRLFNAGTLNVVYDRSYHYALITEALGRISDKDVVFNEEVDD